MAVPVNTLMTEDDYRFMLADSRARVLVVSEALYPRFARLIRQAPDLCTSSSPARWRTGIAISRTCWTRRRRSLGHGADHARRHGVLALHVGLDRQAKGAVHVHADLPLTNDLYAAPTSALNANDVCYSVAKLFFAYGLGNALTFPCGRRRHGAAARPADAGAVAALIAPHKGERVLCGADILCGFLASRPRRIVRRCKLALCVSAGEALPLEVGRRWRERYGVDILDGIGSTEMLHIFLSNRPADVKYGTSGKPVPGYDSKMVDDDGAAVQGGEMGELLVSGPTGAHHVLEQPRAVALDVSRRVDATGRQIYAGRGQAIIVYCGRRDDMLKVSGLYVSPFEVEGALAVHPDVLEAAVVAWLDEDRTDQAQGFRGAQIRRQRLRRTRASIARALQADAGAVQISALDRVPAGVAENRNRENSTLQTQGGDKRAVLIDDM